MNNKQNEHQNDSNDKQSTYLEKKEDLVESHLASAETNTAKALTNAMTKFNPAISNTQNDTALKASANVLTKFNPNLNNIYSDTSAKALANAMTKFNPAISNTQNDTALKALTNAMIRFSPALYNINGTATAKNIAEQITKIYPTLNKSLFSTITEAIKRDLENKEGFNQIKIPSEIYLNSLSGRTKISISEQNFPDTIKDVQNEEIDDWVNTLATNNKRGLSYCLRYDIYPPIFLLNKIPHLSSQVQQIVRLTKLAYLMLFELDQTVLLQIDSYGFFLVYY